MSTVAEQLRAAREAQKLTVQQIADMTKIRTDHINALEIGDFSVFSAPIYIRGSVKNYATRLKLDVPQIMAALDAELGRTEKFSEPPPLSDVTKTPLDHVTYWLAKLNMKMALAAAALLGLVLIILLVHTVLKHSHKGDSSVKVPPARYEPANSGDTLPLPKK
jgi:cytoskeletal protein RodZ